MGETNGIIQWLFEAGIEASEAFPLLLFIGIGAMIDFGPLLANPKLFLFGAAAQVGIFLTIIAAALLGFDIIDAASIGIIGAADGPTSILVSQVLGSRYVGAIAVAAYSYMALVPIIQPFAIKLVTTKKERAMSMPYAAGQVSRRTRILFPIVVSIVAGLVAPASVSLVGFLMFGNLIRECGVLESLSKTAQHELANLITLLLGITISFSMRAAQFVTIRNAAHPVSGPDRVRAGFDRRRAVCQGTQPVLQKQGQPHDRRGRHIGLPHVRARDREARHAGRLHQPPADARGGRERRGSDRLGRGRRRDPWIFHVRKGRVKDE